MGWVEVTWSKGRVLAAPPLHTRQGPRSLIRPESGVVLLRAPRRRCTVLVIAVTLLVAVVGLLVYALAANPKVAEIGRIAFFDGLLVFLLRFGAEVLRLK
jgi:hypothetical protein